MIKLSKCCKDKIIVAHGCDSDFGHGGKGCDCLEKGGVTCWDACSKCGKPCEAIQSYEKKNDIQIEWNWEEEFDELCSNGEFEYQDRDWNNHIDFECIKEFIKGAIKKAREEEREKAIQEICDLFKDYRWLEDISKALQSLIENKSNL